MNEPAKSGATPVVGTGKRILVIDGSPQGQGFCRALAETYVIGARSQGHVVRQLRLADLRFDPVLRGGYEHDQRLEADLLDAQRQIHWAEHLVFVYPVWWGGLPALLKGFIDRVFLPGFAFRLRGQTRIAEQLLSGRSAELLVTLDTPSWHFRWLQGAPAHRQMIRSTLRFCGIRTRRVHEFTPIRGSSEERRQDWLRRAERLGEKV
jgi:NAD(P)H dehydrogenase (quinone)